MEWCPLGSNTFSHFRANPATTFRNTNPLPRSLPSSIHASSRSHRRLAAPSIIWVGFTLCLMETCLPPKLTEALALTFKATGTMPGWLRLWEQTRRERDPWLTWIQWTPARRATRQKFANIRRGSTLRSCVLHCGVRRKKELNDILWCAKVSRKRGPRNWLTSTNKYFCLISPGF